jgi:thiol:disulfide interchange protein DsbD
MPAAIPARFVITALPLLVLYATAPAVAQLQTSPAIGAPPGASTSIVEGVMLPTDAFALSAFVEADGYVALLWELPPEGYYLYRKSLALSLSDGTELTEFEIPAGRIVEDEFFGESEVYYERLLLRVPLSTIPATAITSSANGARELQLLVAYQGCAEDKYCYPPQYTELAVEIPE